MIINLGQNGLYFIQYKADVVPRAGDTITIAEDVGDSLDEESYWRVLSVNHFIKSSLPIRVNKILHSVNVQVEQIKKEEL